MKQSFWMHIEIILDTETGELSYGRRYVTIPQETKNKRNEKEKIDVPAVEVLGEEVI
ncbi:MAG: hypothetical protein QXN68_00495 [Thermoplasmata archaeon]